MILSDDSAALAVVFAISTLAAAGDYTSGSAANFIRGLANAGTGWGETPKNIALESEKINVLVGITYGALELGRP